MQPGVGDAELVEPGDVFISQPKTELTGMLTELAQTNEKLAAITDNLLEVSEKMNTDQGAEKLVINMEALKDNWFFRGYFRRQAKRERKNKSEQQE